MSPYYFATARGIDHRELERTWKCGPGFVEPTSFALKDKFLEIGIEVIRDDRADDAR